MPKCLPRRCDPASRAGAVSIREAYPRHVLRIEYDGSIESVIECYPHLTAQQVKDALFFCQALLEPVN